MESERILARAEDALRRHGMEPRLAQRARAARRRSFFGKVKRIAAHDHVLTPGRYVGAADIEDDGEPLDEKIARLTAEIRDGFETRAQLQGLVLESLSRLEADSSE